MALILKKHTGDTAAQVSAVLGVSTKQFRQFTVYASPDNAAMAYLGPSTVQDDGTAHDLGINTGLSINLGPQDSERPFVVDTDRLYVVAAAGEIVYFIVNTEDGR